MRAMSCCFRVSYGEAAGTQRIRSLTCVVNSGEREATTYSYFVFWAVIPRVLNWASTCANQRCGSEGQKGGNLRLTAEIASAACVSSATDMS